MKLWADRRTDATRSCCSPLAVLGASGLAHSLGIPHLTLDLEPQFRARVVDGFIAGYRAGRTPNPCVVCNGELRIDAMLALADRLGCSALATGHYARLVDDGEGPLLSTAADPAKDQTYMLSGLRPRTLARLRFPLAELSKREVRELAAAAGLPVAGKAESQDLCFLAGEGKRRFLARHGGLGERTGAIVDSAGRHLGEHPGHHNFTVGQRRGLGLASAAPLYVLATEADANQVVVGSREQLARTTVRVREATLHRPGGRVDRVRLRYHSAPLACEMARVPAGEHAELELELAEPAYGVAPGPDRLPDVRRGRGRAGDDRLIRPEWRPTLGARCAPTRSARRSFPSSSSGATCGCRRRRWSRPPTTPRPCSRSPGCSR